MEGECVVREVVLGIVPDGVQVIAVGGVVDLDQEPGSLDADVEGVRGLVRCCEGEVQRVSPRGLDLGATRPGGGLVPQADEALDELVQEDACVWRHLPAWDAGRLTAPPDAPYLAQHEIPIPVIAEGRALPQGCGERVVESPGEVLLTAEHGDPGGREALGHDPRLRAEKERRGDEGRAAHVRHVQ